MWRLIKAAALAALVVATGRWTIMSNQERINAIADKLDKAHGEIVAGIADLKDQVARGEELDFSRLDAGAQKLDDLHEDAVPEPETPEVPVEDVEVDPDQPA